MTLLYFECVLLDATVATPVEVAPVVYIYIYIYTNMQIVTEQKIPIKESI
jgi:hypothetical protein